MNRYLFLIGALLPTGATATGVSFGLGSGEGLIEALFILFAIIAGFVFMIRSFFSIRNDTLDHEKKEEVSDQSHSKTGDDENIQ